MKIKNFFFLFSFSIIIVSCQYFKSNPQLALARIQNDYFYFEDIKDIFPENLSKEDSIIYVKNQILKWAKNHIIYDKALINLDQDLLKGRYLKIKSDNYNIKDVVKRFRRFNKNDVAFLDSISLQFTSFYFNDSVWINKEMFFNKLPEINKNIKNRIIKKLLFYQLEDSLELYLIKINESIFRNDLAPIEFIQPTLKQILLNKKKLEFISKFEKDLIDDAIQKKEFEFYETN